MFAVHPKLDSARTSNDTSEEESSVEQKGQKIYKAALQSVLLVVFSTNTQAFLQDGTAHNDLF